MYKNKTKSITLIVIGSVLLIFATAPYLLSIILGLLGLYLINYGLRVSGNPPLLYLVQNWFDNLHLF